MNGALRVTLAPRGSDHALVFSRGNLHIALGSRAAIGRLAPSKAGLAEDLSMVRRALRPDGDVISWESAEAAMMEVKKLGGWLLHELLGAEWGRAEELENYLRYAVPEWREGVRGRVETWIEPSSTCPPELANFPFELLPVFDRALPGKIDSLHALAQAASALLGFSTVLVRRREEDRWAGALRFKRSANTGRVPVLVFRDAKSLRAVKGEIAFIASGTSSFHVVSSWPTGIASRFEDALAKTMFSAEAQTNTMPEILHFCCHYVSGASSSFGFADESQRQIRVSLKDLKSARVRLNGPRRAPPLVFLNACESSSFDPAGAVSLIEMLRQDGNAAVIGAETSIPDRAASFFAQRVFSRLASGQPLGLAVFRARWDLLEEWRSLAGIFFSLHGRTDLYVGKQHAA